ncbi:hypothetical protein [Pseudodesulfovibrio sp.]|uniref:hypothetical protein n=1 Tax=unclassified Pseudodesulfovibrio TaxID=2661612 RepID=UPI003B00502D
MTPAEARHRLYLIAYALEELSRVTENSTEAALSNTLGILSITMDEAVGVVHTYIPNPPGHTDKDARP